MLNWVALLRVRRITESSWHRPECFAAFFGPWAPGQTAWCCPCPCHFHVGRKRRPSRRERAQENWSTLKLLKQWEKLSLKEEEILFRVSKDLATGKRFQYVAPQSLRSDVLRGCHEDAGHQGQLRTMHLVKQRFYWANMERDVAHPCEVLHQVCVMSKTPEPDGRAPLENVKTTAPLELVCIDFWTAEEEAKGRAMNVFVVTDHYTKLSHAFCCSD